MFPIFNPTNKLLTDVNMIHPYRLQIFILLNHITVVIQGRNSAQFENDGDINNELYLYLSAY